HGHVGRGDECLLRTAAEQGLNRTREQTLAAVGTKLSPENRAAILADQFGQLLGQRTDRRLIDVQYAVTRADARGGRSCGLVQRMNNCELQFVHSLPCLSPSHRRGCDSLRGPGDSMAVRPTPCKRRGLRLPQAVPSWEASCQSPM